MPLVTPNNQPVTAAEHSEHALCTFLEWDSNFFGVRIARLNASRLDEETLASALQWCNSNRIDCLYFLADADHAMTPILAEKNGFHLTDVRVTYERPLAQNETFPAHGTIRLAREQDLPTLREIARNTHRDTRFYFDGRFDRDKCDQFYATWVENSLRGFAQAVLVAEVAGIPAAYLTCHLKANESQIGLLGVGAQHQGRGLGTKLVQQFFSWSREHNAQRATVVTQGRNLAAQRLYQRNSFVTASLQLWYHRWLSR
jgi:dTDP-4-amino-4,6-dideoxy-D-galactose acyltransferase